MTPPPQYISEKLLLTDRRTVLPVSAAAGWLPLYSPPQCARVITAATLFLKPPMSRRMVARSQYFGLLSAICIASVC